MDNRWKILIVDDEESVHQITKLALTGFEFEGREIEYLDAYSGQDCLELMRQHKDVAIVLLDVVMETDDAGLQVCRTIRNDMKNRPVRILLRTGQPGQAPEQEEIVGYEINGYLEKTDLTMERLTNHIIVALRGYRDILALEGVRRGYELVMDSTHELLEQRLARGFLLGALRELAALLYLQHEPVFPHLFALAQDDTRGGEVEVFVCLAPDAADGSEGVSVAYDVIDQAVGSNRPTYSDSDHFVAIHRVDGRAYVLYLAIDGYELSEQDQQLVFMFCQRAAMFVERHR